MNLNKEVVEESTVTGENNARAHKYGSEEGQFNKVVGGAEEDCSETGLTLMEELLLLGLKDKLGYRSIYNDYISDLLRGCILIELGLRGRVKLEGNWMPRRSLPARKVIVKNDDTLGDSFLDEALQHLKETDPPESVKSWIQCDGDLNGEPSNPYRSRDRLKNARERLTKNLKKDVLTTQQEDFLFLAMLAHPVTDNKIKARLSQKIHEALLSQWMDNPQDMDNRRLALTYLASVAGVLENALAPLSGDDYKLATERVKKLLNLNFDEEARKPGACEVLWAVVAFFNRNNVFVSFWQCNVNL